MKLNELTKKFPDLEANILGVIRNEKFIILKNDIMEKDDKAYVIINFSNALIIAFDITKNIK